MHVYGGFKLQVLQVFGLPEPVDERRDECLHLTESACVSFSSLEACVATVKDIMKIQCTNCCSCGKCVVKYL